MRLARESVCARQDAKCDALVSDMAQCDNGRTRAAPVACRCALELDLRWEIKMRRRPRCGSKRDGMRCAGLSLKMRQNLGWAEEGEYGWGEEGRGDVVARRNVAEKTMDGVGGTKTTRLG